jgi:hypothetical protein
VKHQGLTIFALFFGISLLEALRGGDWMVIAFWLSVGVFFVAMDRPRKTRYAPREQPPSR